MDEQPIVREQIQTTQTKIPITTLEIVLKPGKEYFHCIEHNRLYIDPDCKIPLADLSSLQGDLRLEKESQVIPHLISEGYLIRSGLCEDCQHDTLDGMAEA